MWSLCYLFNFLNGYCVLFYYFVLYNEIFFLYGFICLKYNFCSFGKNRSIRSYMVGFIEFLWVNWYKIIFIIWGRFEFYI